MCEHGRFHRVRGLLVALAGALLLARPTPLAASPPDAVGQLHSTACFAPSADPSAKPLQARPHARAPAAAAPAPPLLHPSTAHPFPATPPAARLAHSS